MASKKHAAAVGILLIVALSLFGCASSNEYMKPSVQEGAAPVAGDNESVVVFMRPSGEGPVIKTSSSVFDINDKDESFLGIVSAKKKVVCRTTPGEHVFMVIGESADFMKASLQAGKTYYVLVVQRMGGWKARFSLKPVTKNELISRQFKTWYADCELTENTPGAFQWAKDNAESIRSKRTEYWKKWNERSEADKPTLNPDDCL
jgi:hypothetical protein